MTRDEYECLQAIRFDLPIISEWPVWVTLINRGWIVHVAPLGARFVATPAGEQALREYR